MSVVAKAAVGAGAKAASKTVKKGPPVHAGMKESVKRRIVLAERARYNEDGTLREPGPIRPVALVFESLALDGPQTREALWKRLSAHPHTPLRSKRHLKMVMNELVRRDVVVASTDVRRIEELMSKTTKKRLTPKQEPNYIFKLKGMSRYKNAPVVPPAPEADAKAAEAKQ